MMSHKVSKSVGSTKAEIRRLAVFSAAMIWCFAILSGQYYGKTVPEAFSDGAAAALSGFACWLTYHLVSRQNNGLIMVSMSLPPLMRAGHQPFQSTVDLLLPAGVISALIVGVMTRILKPKKRASDLNQPLYDAQLDRPG